MLLFSHFAVAQEASTLATNEEWSNDTWQDEAWDDTPTSPWSFNSFVEIAYGKFTRTNIVKSSSSLHEINSRLNVSYSHTSFELKAKIEAKYDEALHKTNIEARTLNVAFSPIQAVDIKVGKQILTWGTGDYLFLNDLFAKDWRSFFSGRDDEYLKAPSTSVKATGYLHNITFDIVWTPNFTPDNYINGERFSYYSSLSQSLVAPAQPFKVNTTNKAQWSARASTTYKDVEYALYGYKGFWTTPLSLQLDHNNEVQAYFSALNTWGASVRLPLGKGILNTEYAYYNSIEQLPPTRSAVNNKHLFTPNSQSRLLLGYEIELIKNLTLNTQFYVEHTENHHQLLASHQSSTKDVLVKENRTLITTRLSYSALQQKLRYVLFNFYSPSDDDGYIKPSINYRHNDRWSFAVGANIFYGENNQSFFGQHQQNSNVWLRIKAHL